jgi:hypothetical protein
LILSLLICLVIAILSGCGGSDAGRYGVSGKVTLAGKPIQSGVITFIREGEMAAAGGAPIIQGAYSIPASAGLPEGSYRVAVSVPDSGPAAKDEVPGISVPPKEAIPAKYNSRTELRAKVGRGAPNAFDFELK